MPVDFLSDEQADAYSRFAGAPSRSDLERYFFLDDTDLELVKQRRRDSNRLGFGLALGTVRFLGTFLPDPREVPTEVVAYVAGQLGIQSPASFGAYAERAKTPYEHTWKICKAYGYRELDEAEEKGLREFLAARAWASTEGPRALLDRGVAWLRERKVLLPGVTRLTRLVIAVRAEASERLWRALADGADDALRQRLRHLLEVEEESRFSALERLRTSPPAFPDWSRSAPWSAWPRSGRSAPTLWTSLLCHRTRWSPWLATAWGQRHPPSGTLVSPGARPCWWPRSRSWGRRLSTTRWTCSTSSWPPNCWPGPSASLPRNSCGRCPASLPPRPSWRRPSECCSTWPARRASCHWPSCGRGSSAWCPARRSPPPWTRSPNSLLALTRTWTRPGGPSW